MQDFINLFESFRIESIFAPKKFYKNLAYKNTIANFQNLLEIIFIEKKFSTQLHFDMK